MKTIATISTPIGSGAIGIVRMSGDNALQIASKMFVTPNLPSISMAIPNMMYYGELTAGRIKDKCLAVVFKAPRSYTGEDLVEFQCHGGVRLVSEVFRACLDNGACVADKGEFTKRAFLNGKVALSDAEGIIDMINSESVGGINAGYRLAMGGVTGKVNECQQMLLDCVAHLEASLDYPEEMEEESKQNANTVINKLINQLVELEKTSIIGGYIKTGITVAIVGQANVGKSSLLNKLLGKERAIVTEIAGTTRDSVEESIEVDGILLRLVDTAGIRDTEDTVEAIGVERSRKIANSSDIVLFVTRADRDMNEEEKQLLEEIQSNSCQKCLIVYNKCDLGLIKHKNKGIAISCKQDKGIEELKKSIVEMFLVKHIDNSCQIITNERHSDALKRAVASLQNAHSSIDEMSTEFTLLDLREAYVALGEITGETASEDIIDRIFSKFCLGK